MPWPFASRSQFHRLLQNHLGESSGVQTVQRAFPYRSAPDAYAGFSKWLETHAPNTSGIGVPVVESFMSTVGIGVLMTPGDWGSQQATAVEHEAIRVGEDTQLLCPKHALWLLRVDSEPLALLWTSSIQRSGCGLATQLQLEIAGRSGELFQEQATGFFSKIDDAVKQAATYRGRILSLEDDPLDGSSLGVTVHKLRSIERDEVVLPEPTVRLLERNVIRFVEQAPTLRRFGMPTKKGLLFYGPPGTGKTHTIHYLINALPGRTTLLVTAEQIGQLSEYAALARLLQPSLVVIEDVDLVARDRATSSVGEQSLLNRLLNEMDGLREDADILFFLTTNRPETLEEALASRPGRIDQAVEFPLPDEIGRRKLMRLYAGDATLDEDLLNDVVSRTEGVSAAFVKELLRKATQFHLECNPKAETLSLSLNDFDQALEELLFHGGMLNRRVLGAG